MNKITFSAAIFAFTGVALGAFGAHTLQSSLESHGMVKTWETAVFYHLIHAVATWALGFRAIRATKWDRRAGQFWLIGILLFSGSLYVLALGGPRFLGPVTPLGGLALMIGWICAARAALDQKSHD